LSHPLGCGRNESRGGDLLGLLPYLTVSPQNMCDQLVDRAYWSQSSTGKATFNGVKTTEDQTPDAHL